METMALSRKTEPGDDPPTLPLHAAAPAERGIPSQSGLADERLVKATLLQIFDELFWHDGYATLRVEMRILKRGQKEVILDAGKQFRFVLEFKPEADPPRRG